MNESHLRAAIDLATQHMQGGEGGPFGAVIVKEGAVIARGWNRVTSSNDPTAHAEVNAIRAACAELATFDLSGCELYTSCEPCPMCLGAIYWARLDRVYYAASRHDAALAGFSDEELYEEIPKPIEERRIPMTRALEEEGKAPFTAWAEKSDRIPY